MNTILRQLAEKRKKRLAIIAEIWRNIGAEKRLPELCTIIANLQHANTINHDMAIARLIAMNEFIMKRQRLGRPATQNEIILFHQRLARESF